MLTPLEKLRKADRDLKGTAVVCLFVGLLDIGVILRLYLKHEFSNLWGRELPVNAYKLYIKALLIETCWVLPSLGLLLVLVAWAIWRYRRKRDAVKEHDKIDAS
jgi:hypothetical protein